MERSGLFDPEWYLFRYPDVAGFPGGPIGHFVRHGLAENREPSPHVNLGNYLLRRKSAPKGEGFAFIRALADPDPEARDAAWRADDELSLEFLIERSGLFDESWYLRRYPDVVRVSGTPIRHFVHLGSHELRDPGPGFDSDFYRDTYPNYTRTTRTPIEHYVRIGRALGHAPNGPSRYARWLELFDALSEADLGHMTAAGQASARRAFLLHVLDAEACGRIDEILDRAAAQIGIRAEVRILRGAGLERETWEGAAASAEAHGWVIAADAEAALSGATDGDTVILVAGVSLLRSHACHVLADALEESGAEAAYSDHDHVDAVGARSRPVFKPSMSPIFMSRVPYAGNVVAARVGERMRKPVGDALMAALSGEGASAWARLLLDLPPARAVHVPFLLFHRPGASHDPAGSLEPVPELPLRPEAAELPLPPSVTIVIPTRDRSDLLRACVDSIEDGTEYGGRYDILVVDNSSAEPETIAYLEELRARPNVSVIPSPGRFNFAAVCNQGAAAASGEILVFLNNDTTVRQRDWLTKLVSHAARTGTGAVGAQLLYPDGTVQHGGTVLGIQGVGAHRLVGIDAAVAAGLDATREMTAVTGACLAIRRDLFWELGGFDPILQVAFNDVKLCATAHDRGFRNVYVAEPLLNHYESRSRGYDDSQSKHLRNRREAIYVRERFGQLFRNDPFYSPNLSLQKVGELARPPRVLRPWRRRKENRRKALFLSRVQGVGYGVPLVVELQAAHLQARGWDVVLGGPQNGTEEVDLSFSRADLWTAEAAATFAVAEGFDCIIAHTPPFFSMTRFLGERPFLYVVDHGEPYPHLFPDAAQREVVDWEKRFCAPLARRVFAISETVRRHQFRHDAIVLRNGNDHLSAWSPDWAARRAELRRALGFEGRFIVFNVCRFGEGERFYKGLSRYAEVASDTPFFHPELSGRVDFAVAGRGDRDDVQDLEALGLMVFANVSDREMAELYAASDLFLNLSQWEGYNLGIGQALAMGLGVVASNIEAHREFGVETHDSVPDLCAAIARRIASWREETTDRRPILRPWRTSLDIFAETIEADLDAPDAMPWR